MVYLRFANNKTQAARRDGSARNAASLRVIILIFYYVLVVCRRLSGLCAAGFGNAKQKPRRAYKGIIVVHLGSKITSDSSRRFVK